MKNNLSREQKIFIKIAKAYSKTRPDLSFQFTFDALVQPLIGSNTARKIEVSFVDSDRLFKRIFSEGNVGLGEGYSEGLIHVKDEDYKEFLFICIYATSPKILFKLSPFDIIAVIRARMAGYFTKPRQGASIDNHYS